MLNTAENKTTQTLKNVNKNIGQLNNTTVASILLGSE